MSYDNIPITAKTWEQINIKWHGGYAKLLRPIKYAHQYGFVVGAHSRIDLAEFGVPNANVRVMAVKPLSRQTANRIDHLPKDEKPIIGVYVHQTNDVRTYTFKDAAHRKISIIHATPVHPFYVKNLQAYVPISKVTGAMELIGKNDEIIHLVCPNNEDNYCGIRYRIGKKTTVYNVEIYQRHFYRVGKRQILVHNGCLLSKASRQEPNDLTGGLVNTVKKYNEEYTHVGTREPSSGADFQIAYRHNDTMVVTAAYKRSSHLYASDMVVAGYEYAKSVGELEHFNLKKMRLAAISNDELTKLMPVSKSSDDITSQFKLTKMGKFSNYVANEFDMEIYRAVWDIIPDEQSYNINLELKPK